MLHVGCSLVRRVRQGPRGHINRNEAQLGELGDMCSMKLINTHSKH